MVKQSFILLMFVFSLLLRRIPALQWVWTEHLSTEDSGSRVRFFKGCSVSVKVNWHGKVALTASEEVPVFSFHSWETCSLAKTTEHLASVSLWFCVMLCPRIPGSLRHVYGWIPLAQPCAYPNWALCSVVLRIRSASWQSGSYIIIAMINNHHLLNIHTCLIQGLAFYMDYMFHISFNHIANPWCRYYY